MTTVAELLALARRAAAAGAEILAARDPQQLGARMKRGEADWVTDFDFAAEQAVRSVIQEARGADIITGEELAPAVSEQPSGYRWSIDPLDGTMNFLRNIAYYGTSVAVHGPHPEDPGQNVWLAGVVDAPALGRVYYASLGHGAWCQERHRDGSEVTRELTGPRQARQGRLLGTSFTDDPTLKEQLLAELPQRMQHFAGYRELGSAALELCAVAEGGLDAYFEYGLQEHDFAAGALIAEEAGAWVRRAPLSPATEGLPAREEVLSQWTAAAVPDIVASFIPQELPQESRQEASGTSQKSRRKEA